MKRKPENRTSDNSFLQTPKKNTNIPMPKSESNRNDISFSKLKE